MSIDWTVQTRNYPAIEKRYSSNALGTDNHFTLEQWYALGKQLLYLDHETIEACRIRYQGGFVEAPLREGGAVAQQTAPEARIIRLSGARSELNLARYG